MGKHPVIVNTKAKSMDFWPELVSSFLYGSVLKAWVQTHIQTACLSVNTAFPGFAPSFQGLKLLSLQQHRLWCLVSIFK